MIKLKTFKLINPVIKIVTKSGHKRYWNFYLDIPTIDIIAGPLSHEWPLRIKEEIKVFNKWKKIDLSFPFKDLRIDPRNSRRFFVDINVRELFDVRDKEWFTISILIPITYPRNWPSIGDPLRDTEFFRILRSWTNNHPFCMPPILRNWWSKFKGKAGITHFLQAFSIFVTIAGRKTTAMKKYITEI